MRGPFAYVVVALAGCVELKQPSEALPDASADLESSPVPAVDASTGERGDGPTADAGDAYAKLGEELTRKRVRLADVPAYWFVSRSRVYTVDTQTKAHSYRPRDGTRVDYTFELRPWSHLTGNDDYVVDDADDVTVYAAGESNHVVASFPRNASWDDPKAASKAIAIVQATGAGRDLLLWSPQLTGAPEVVLSFAANAGLRFMRARDDALYFAEATGTTLWSIDTAKKTAVGTSLSRTPTGLDVAGSALVVESSGGGAVSYELVAEGKAPRDLTAEISAAPSVIPGSKRMAVGSFSQFGHWLLYAAWGGIFAFDIARGRLVACQIRALDDGVYLAPRVLEDQGMLVFARNAGPTQTSSSQGLYFVPLASVLPP